MLKYINKNFDKQNSIILIKLLYLNYSKCFIANKIFQIKITLKVISIIHIRKLSNITSHTFLFKILGYLNKNISINILIYVHS